jgi:hypothetical protein
MVARMTSRIDGTLNSIEDIDACPTTGAVFGGAPLYLRLDDAINSTNCSLNDFNKETDMYGMVKWHRRLNVMKDTNDQVIYGNLTIIRLALHV